MAAPAGYFDYPFRRKGLDHDHFDMRYLKHAAPVQWPGAKSVALFVTVGVDCYPLDMGGKPFVPPGGNWRPYPDLWTYATRDYGNRVGLYRILKVCEAYGMRATAFVQGEIAKRHPRIVGDLIGSGCEIAAGGLDMGHIHAGALEEETERGYIDATLEALAAAGATDVRGWRSPAFSETARTLPLLAAAGLSYCGDWVNDDMPYAMRTVAGPLVAMPYQYERADMRILFEQNQSLEEFESQILAAFDVLKAEATPESGRVMSLALSPWVIGQPYRIKALQRLFAVLARDPAVWIGTGSEIADACAPSLGISSKEAAE
jgi:allantoinase